MFVIMTDNEKTTKTQAKSNEALRESIVQRLKAHDAAIRSATSDQATKTTPSRNQ